MGVSTSPRAEPETSNQPPDPRTASARLRRKIDLVSGAFGRACHDVFVHPRLNELWAEYMITQHTIIKSTVPLLRAGRDHGRALGADDPVAAGVADYFDKHIEEEMHHDDWLLDDLEAMGVSRREALDRVPSDTVASLVGSQYYWVFHYHPVALLGYFAFMEGFPPHPSLIAELIQRSGLSREAFRTFALHGEVDPTHREELDRTIDSLPLSAEHETALGVSALSTANHITTSLQEVAGTLHRA